MLQDGRNGMYIGLDRLTEMEFGGRRVALVTNDAAFDSSWRRSRDVVGHHAHLVALYTPEHGLGGERAAGESVEDSTDRESGLPVRSLYRGERLTVDPSRFSDVDLLIFDIQDVGLRFYTYISTLRQLLTQSVPVLVLDRPNPLGGEVVEGVLLDEAYESFVGPAGLPTRYGLTIGELGQWMKDAYGLPCPYSVLWMEGWRRDSLWPTLGRPWSMSSPALAHSDALFCYAGFCLFEGTNLSEGRGTSAPFELFGAPFIDRLRLLEAVRRLALDGVAFTAISFTPTAGTWAGQLCHGLYAHITDHARFRPFDCAVRLLGLIWDFHGDELEFLPIFERLAGFGRAMITEGRAEEVLHAASSDAEIFSKEKKQYEHYR